jgi:hypothetical protein
VPEAEFDCPPQESDFSVLLFPDSDRESGFPQLYEQGEFVPVFDTK